MTKTPVALPARHCSGAAGAALQQPPPPKKRQKIAKQSNKMKRTNGASGARGGLTHPPPPRKRGLDGCNAPRPARAFFVLALRSKIIQKKKVHPTPLCFNAITVVLIIALILIIAEPKSINIFMIINLSFLILILILILILTLNSFNWQLSSERVPPPLRARAPQ